MNNEINKKKRKYTNLIKTEMMRGGGLKFSFFQLEVFKVLLTEFGYNYIMIGGKGKYLKSAPEGYEIVRFHKLQDSFMDYLRYHFDRSSIPEGISYEDFLNKYYQSRPINQHYAKSFFQAENKLDENDFILENEFLKFK